MSNPLPSDEGHKATLSDTVLAGLGEKGSLHSVDSAAPPLGIPIEVPTGFRGRFTKNYIDLDSIATQPSVFDDPLTLEVNSFINVVVLSSLHQI